MQSHAEPRSSREHDLGGKQKVRRISSQRLQLDNAVGVEDVEHVSLEIDPKRATLPSWSAVDQVPFRLEAVRARGSTATSMKRLRKNRWVGRAEEAHDPGTVNPGPA